jgi:hypothetical protein
MVAAETSYCLADIAGEHLRVVGGWIPAEHYSEHRADVLHFPTRADAETVARWMRTVYRCHMRVVAVPPVGPPALCGPHSDARR